MAGSHQALGPAAAMAHTMAHTWNQYCVVSLVSPVITSSSLSSMACISAWVGGLETVKPSCCTWAAVSNRLWMPWNSPRSSADRIGESGRVLSEKCPAQRPDPAVKSNERDAGVVWLNPLHEKNPYSLLKVGLRLPSGEGK